MKLIGTIDYTIIQCESIHELVESVNYEAQKGWRPMGGVAVDRRPPGGNYETMYYQAMVRETEI